MARPKSIRQSYVRGLFFAGFSLMLGVWFGLKITLPGLGGLATGVFLILSICSLGGALTDRCGARGYGGYLLESIAALLIAAFVYPDEEDGDDWPERRIAIFFVPLHLSPWVGAAIVIGLGFFDSRVDAAQCFLSAVYFGALGVVVTLVSIVTYPIRRIDREKMQESIDAIMAHHKDPKNQPYPAKVHPWGMRLVNTSGDKPTVILDWLDDSSALGAGILMMVIGMAMLIVFT